ncbi:hypothetical protein NMG60_11033252 [Bertholletia excelsa]
MKGDRMAKRSSFGSIVRKRLSDITNSIPQTRSPVPAKKLSPTNSSEKEYINQLVKENLELVKIIADKNKMIELTALELQKMRVHLQKMQLQNWNLAQSNSHITAELNLGKEKLKALQHEIVCKDAVLKAKNLELEEKAKTRNRSSCSQPGDGVVEEHNSHDERRPGKGQRRRVTRSPSIGPSNTFQQLADKDTTGNKRRCLRRKSTSFESQQQEAHDKSVEITGKYQRKMEVVPQDLKLGDHNGLLPADHCGDPLKRLAPTRKFPLMSKYEDQDEVRRCICTMFSHW